MKKPKQSFNWTTYTDILNSQFWICVSLVWITLLAALVVILKVENVSDFKACGLF